MPGGLRGLSRRTRNWVLIGVVVLIIVALQLTTTPPRTLSAYFDLPAPRVIAHQGGNLLRPGNTLLAFDHAVALGADVLEMDLHRSRDGHVVVIHDDTVDRTTDGSGTVAEQTLAQLTALDAAYHWPFDGDSRPYRGQGVRIPTLVEVLDRYPAQPMLMEIKQDQPPLETELCALLTGHGMRQLVLIASFNHAALARFRAACPGVATSASAREAGWFVAYQTLGLTRLFAAPAVVVHLPRERYGMALLEAGRVKAAVGEGVQTEFWTLNDVQAMRAAIRSGAGGIITDRPDLLMGELGRR